MLTINGEEVDHQLAAIKQRISSETSPFIKHSLSLIFDWQSGKSTFTFFTSGSTGSRKQVILKRAILQYSAESTLNALHVNQEGMKSWVAIDTRYIGGSMAVIRALVAKHDLHLVTPSASPFSASPFNNGEMTIDLISLVPLQVQQICDEDPALFHRTRNVIIGGAPLNQRYLHVLNQLDSTNCYHSYGMTETASHFALKKLNGDNDPHFFETIGDAKIAKDDNGCLQVKGTVTDHQWITTTDLVRIVNDKQFEWLGRADNVINSGGIKISPEEVERQLEGQLSCAYFIAGLPDERLGSKAVLIVASPKAIDLSTLDFGGINPYYIPKEAINLNQFVYTETDKINRIATLKQLKN